MQQAQNGIASLPLMMWSPMFWLGARSNSNDTAKPGSASGSAPAPVQGVAAIGGNALKASAQASNEVMGLISRRSQAYLAFATEAAKCRAPHELFALQMQFCQTAFQHHTEAARKLAAVWNVALPLPLMAGAGQSGWPTAPQRDRITFAEPDATSTSTANGPSQSAARTPGDRRSAA